MLKVKLSMGLLILVCLMKTGMGAGPVTAVAGAARKIPRLLEAARKMTNPQTMNQLLGSSTNAFDKLKNGVKWFRKMRDAVNGRKPISGAMKKARQSRLLDEIYICRPDNFMVTGKSCYGPCEKNGYSYRWCHTSSERRSGESYACSCRLKDVVVEYLAMSKEKLLVDPVRPWTPIEIGALTASGILSVVIVIGLAIIGIRFLRQRQENEPNPHGPGDVGFFHVNMNPLYQPPDQQHQEE